MRSVQCLGFVLGVFHVECKYTSRGPRLIEVNCRMGGGPVRDTNLIVWGVDLVEEHLMACAGIPVRPPVAKRPLKQMAEFTVNAAKTGILQVRPRGLSLGNGWGKNDDTAGTLAGASCGNGGERGTVGWSVKASGDGVKNDVDDAMEEKEIEGIQGRQV